MLISAEAEKSGKMNRKVAITGGLVFLAGLSYMLVELETGLAVGLVGIAAVAVGLYGH